MGMRVEGNAHVRLRLLVKGVGVGPPLWMTRHHLAGVLPGGGFVVMATEVGETELQTEG